MEQIMNYVKPELIVVAVVLYLIGMGLKKAGAVPDKYIPLILGGIGIVLCAAWVLAASPLKGVQDIFTAVIQGILVAWLCTYVNQIVKQDGK